MGKIVLKIGGLTLGSLDTTPENLVSLQKKRKPLEVVLGGAHYGILCHLWGRSLG